MAEEELKRSLTASPGNSPGPTTQSHVIADKKQSNPPSEYTATSEKDAFHWAVTMQAPIQTPYEGRALQLSVSFPEAYPFDAPKVAFTSRVYHLNVDAKGEIRLNTLQDKWAPNMNMHETLLSIHKLLIEPNPASPADSEIEKLWKSDREAYNRKAMDTVR